MRYIVIYVVLLAFVAAVAPSQNDNHGTVQNLVGADGNLRLYREGGESLSVSRRGKARTLISAASGTATRRIYDDSGRLTSRQVWSTQQKACIKDEEYSYDAGDKPVRCVITDGDKASGSWTVTDRRFDSAGNLAEERVWSVEMVEDKDAPVVTSKDDTPQDKSKKEERHLTKVVTNKYDAQGNVSEVVTLTRAADGTKHAVREVHDGRDTYRYENGVLRMSTVYTAGADDADDAKDDYTVTVIFGDGDSRMKIATDYKDGRKSATRVIQ